MLHVFRKYEKYVFIVITVVIIISFSFFGTYSTLQRNQIVEKRAFTSIDGTEVSRQELEELSHFLASDNEDKVLLGGSWGPNFLNDGVIKKDFIDTGMAEILVAPFISELAPDLRPRFQREKRFAPYAHPQAKFLSAVNAWSIVAPQINAQLNALRGLHDSASPEGFAIRVKLFQAERQFPHSALRFVLRYQQKQYQGFQPDPNLDRTDLALFGYHTVNDWFGPRFIRLTAEFIINSAIIAEQRGYFVSKDEALADLYNNAEMSFQQNINNPKLGVATVQDFFSEQLRRMGMDQNKAVNLWRKVLLFRRLFRDFGTSVFVDPQTVRQFHTYAMETVEGELFKVPEELQIGDFRSLQKFELYLQAVSERQEKGKELLDLPHRFKSVEQVKKEHPELVQNRYLLEVAKVDKRSLQAKVGVKETWGWEARKENWEKLKKEFPELGIKKGETEEQRYEALNSLDNKTRARVDIFAREQIVDVHPEWITQALAAAPLEKVAVGIRLKGENVLFPGLKKPQELISLLNQYPEQKAQLAEYTPDSINYYAIAVLDHTPNLELLTFAEANRDGTMDSLLDTYLEKQYEAVRKQNPKDFQNKDGSWKPLHQVKFAIAEKAFSPILEQIKNEVATNNLAGEEPKEMIPDFAAPYRLFSYMKGLKDKFETHPDTINEWIRKENGETAADKLPPAKSLEAQWKIVKEIYKADRGASGTLIDTEELFQLEPGAWSSVDPHPNGQIAFLHLEKRYSASDPLGLYEKVFQTQRLLSIGAQQELARELMKMMQSKHALSLKFYNQEEIQEE